MKFFLSFIFLTATISFGSVILAQQTEELSALFDRTLDAATEPADIRRYLSPLTASDLEKLALETQRAIKNAMLLSVQLNAGLPDASAEERDAIRSQIIDNSEATYDLASKYRRILNAWDYRGGAADKITPHRRYLFSVASDLIRTTELRALIALASDWLVSPSGGIRALFNLGVFAGCIFGIFAVSSVFSKVAERRLSRSADLSSLLRNFLKRLVYWVAFIVGLFIVLSNYGVRTTPLLTVFGGISFILGLALQQTIGNLFSGVMIMLNKPFDLGDEIRIGDEVGMVSRMSLVSTQLTTADNRVLQIPNGKVWSDVISNASAEKMRRVDLVFRISYSEDCERAIEILTRIVRQNPLCLEKPQAEVFVGELGEHTVNLFCRPWAHTEDYWEVYKSLLADAKQAFDAESIAAPSPQMDIHIRSQP
jgi:small conductance mechanosensitive channel